MEPWERNVVMKVITDGEYVEVVRMGWRNRTKETVLKMTPDNAESLAKQLLATVARIKVVT